MPSNRAWDAGGEVMRRKGRDQWWGGAQLVSGDPFLPYPGISASLLFQAGVSDLIFTLAFDHTQRGWRVGQGGVEVGALKGMGESGFQGDTPPPPCAGICCQK